LFLRKAGLKYDMRKYSKLRNIVCSEKDSGNWIYFKYWSFFWICM